MSLKWLPNLLTLTRCVLAFVVFWVILEVFSEPGFPDLDRVCAFDSSSEAREFQGLLAVPFALFVFTALTDFVDGYAARKLQAESEFGALLDPIADKLLVALSLVALCMLFAWDLRLLIPTVVIVARDALITVLRFRPNVVLPVSRFAKWKTAAEMVGIGALLFAFAVSGALQIFTTVLAIATLWLAALLSAWTGGLYVGTLIPDGKRPRP